VATDRLIRPHGGELVDRTGPRPDGLDALETLVLTPRELSDLDMLACGALSPLEGFMNRADYESVVDDMHLTSGLPWALPVCLAVDQAPQGDTVELADEEGRAFAVLEVEEVFEYDRSREAERCFRTTDDAHPGVARLYAPVASGGVFAHHRALGLDTLKAMISPRPMRTDLTLGMSL